MAIPFRLFSAYTPQGGGAGTRDATIPAGYLVRWISANAAGGGDGTTSATSGANGAFTLAEAVTNAGGTGAQNKLYQVMDDGNYSGNFNPNTSGLIALPTVLVGVPNQNGANFHSNGRPVITGLCLVSADWWIENLEFAPATGNSVTVGLRGTLVSVRASTGSASTVFTASTGSRAVGCRSSGGTNGISLSTSSTTLLCTVTGHTGVGILVGNSAEAFLNVVRGGSYGIHVTSTSAWCALNTLDGQTTAHIRYSSGTSPTSFPTFLNILANLGVSGVSLYRNDGTGGGSLFMGAIKDWAYNPNARPVSSTGSGGFNLAYLFSGSANPAFIDPVNMNYSMPDGSALRKQEIQALLAKDAFFDVGGYQHDDAAGGGGGEGATGTIIDRGVNF